MNGKPPPDLYHAESVADEIAVSLGLSDKPCWRVTEPEGFEAIIWTHWRAPQKVIHEALNEIFGPTFTVQPAPSAIVRLA